VRFVRRDAACRPNLATGVISDRQRAAACPAFSQEETKAMTRCILCCVLIFAVAAAAVPSPAPAQPATINKPVLRKPASAPRLIKDDCETRIQKLNASDAEGDERLAEKDEVIEQCLRQYKNDNTIVRLVKECAKYEEQPIIKQQFVAECQLAAFNYANLLRMLKAEYRK
jgi:hypothetical protein